MADDKGSPGFADPAGTWNKRFAADGSLFDMTAPQRLSRFLGVTIQPDYDVASQRQNQAIPLDRFTNPGDVEAYLARRNLSHWARDA